MKLDLLEQLHYPMVLMVETAVMVLVVLYIVRQVPHLRFSIPVFQIVVQSVVMPVLVGQVP